MTSDFQAFKVSRPATEMFRKLGFEEFLETAESWRLLRRLIVDFNDNTERGAWVSAAKRCDGVASSGERVLLHAILHVTDFDWLADELTEGRAWREMNNASGDYRAAVAACIAADIW